MYRFNITVVNGVFLVLKYTHKINFTNNAQLSTFSNIYIYLTLVLCEYVVADV